MTWLDEQTLMIARTLREPTFSRGEYERRLRWVKSMRKGWPSRDYLLGRREESKPMIRVPDCRRPITDLTGRRFGRLTVLGYAGKRGGVIVWSCRCDCGRTGVYAGGSLVRGATRSCGCLRRRKGCSSHGR